MGNDTLLADDANSLEPCAWMRRWRYEGNPPPPKVKNAKGRWEWPKESKFVAVTPIKLFADDIPLYAINPLEHQLATTFIAQQKEQSPSERQRLWLECLRLTAEIEKLEQGGVIQSYEKEAERT